MEYFASDNQAGICPEALEYLLKSNASGHVSSYGEDDWTQRATERFRELFQTDCEVFFVFNGTAANSLALASMCRSYQSVICHQLAHIETDECGAPGFFSHGAKLLGTQGENGKLSIQAIEALIVQRTDVHHARPQVISMTQSTEVGTVYTVEEIHAIAEIAKRFKLHLHMDGARFANAVASLNVDPAEISWRAGVDVLCFGGSKNGLPIGEAVIFFNKQLSHEFSYRVKQAGQLASKMRFISAPWLGLLENHVWLRNARHANTMAQLLFQGISTIPNVKILFETQANAVFAAFPQEAAAHMWEKGWHFYPFVGGYRLMCAWDTTAETVHRFVRELRDVLVR